MAKTIAVDWDGVVYDHETKRLKDGAKDGLYKLFEDGWNIFIYSSNQSDWIARLIEEYELPPMTIWKGSGKPNCDCYLDDRAIRFFNWEQSLWDIDTLYGTEEETER